MLAYTLKRLALMVPVLFGISVIVFLVMALIPGDPATAILGAYATPENTARLRADLGLDRPLVVQYLTWLGNLFEGDFGQSYSLNRPVLDEIIDRLIPTFILAGTALLLCTLFGVAAGVVSAVRQYGWQDKLLTLLVVVGISTPSFWLGLVLIMVFAVELRWLPVSGMYAIYGGGDLPDLIKHLILPAVSLAVVATGVLGRLTRSSMLEVLRQDYVRTARATGLPERKIVYKHAFRNALVAIVPIIGISIVNIPFFARAVRGSTIGLRNQEFVDAARLAGLGNLRILSVEVFPNVLPVIVITSSTTIGWMILETAGLSFLGLGAQPPRADLGSMLGDGRKPITTAPHVATIPGLLILLVVVGINLLGDGLRDVLDPRLKAATGGGPKAAQAPRPAAASAPAPGALLDVAGLSTRFYVGDQVYQAVNGVSFRLAPGEALGIVGESGSGKSVTALSIMGLIPSPPGQIVSGAIRFDGQDLVSAPRGGPAPASRRPHGLHLPGPHDLPEPVAAGRRAGGRERAPAPGRGPGGGHEAGRGAVRSRAPAPGPQAPAQLSPRALGGHAPAGGHRHGARQRPRPSSSPTSRRRRWTSRRRARSCGSSPTCSGRTARR